MTAWDERVRQHTIYAAMQQLGASIDLVLNQPDLSPQVIEVMERIRAVLTYTGKRLAAADTALVASEVLNNITAAFNEAASNLNAFASQRNDSYINSADTSIERTLQWVQSIPGTYSSEELEALMSSVERLKAAADSSLVTANSTLNEYKGKIVSIQADLDGVNATLAKERDRLSQITAEYQGQFSSAQEARSTEFRTTIAAAQESLAKLSTDYQAQFSTAQDARSAEFLSVQAQRQATYAALEESYRDRVLAQDKEFTNQLAFFKAESSAHK